VWHRKLWLIDHGAALYVHYTWADYLARASSRFAAVRDHILLPAASEIGAADAALAPRITPELVEALVAAIPDPWLGDQPPFADPAAHRIAYVEFLLRRLEAPRAFVEEAIDARTRGL
jgi:hypothetical protein